jgi:NodT family efflux transporter outer membrane factor (OMF) lipoprotein
MRGSRRWSAVQSAPLLLLWGCAVGPDYERPELAAPDAWATRIEAEMAQPEPDITRWWETLGDTTLTALIQQAELGNLDLRTAVARVREARAARGIAKGDYFPQVAIDGTYTTFELSSNSIQGQQLVDAGGTIERQEEFVAGAGLFWEIDLFGRVRRQNEAARAAFEGSVEDFRDVLVSLFAEVATAYVDVRTLESRLALLSANVEAQRRTVQLTTDRFNAGLVSRLDVTQAQTNLSVSEAGLPVLETQLNAALNRLSVLIGSPPGSLRATLPTTGTIPQAPDSVATGLPAELLRRRPDVRRAERQLASQTALIGVATADLYPSFSLGGALSLVAGSAGDLGSSESVEWSLIPGVRWNLFAGGKIRSNIAVQEARTEQLLLQYEQSVLLALEEVETALVAFEQERFRRDRIAEAVAAASESVDIVQTQYRSGLVDFQRYVDSERALAVEQDRLAESEGLVVQNLIRLNRALGGGWDPDLVEPDVAQEEAEADESGSNGEVR